MKKIRMALVCLVLSNFSYADESSCYEKLMKGNIDSSAHQIDISNLETHGDSIKDTAITGLNELMRQCGCFQKFKKIQCGQAIKSNSRTAICYVEIAFGYFIISKDFMDNLNIIFNRWDK